MACVSASARAQGLETVVALTIDRSLRRTQHIGFLTMAQALYDWLPEFPYSRMDLYQTDSCPSCPSATMRSLRSCPLHCRRRSPFHQNTERALPRST